MKFEYQILKMYYNKDETSDDIESKLNYEGERNWEIIFVEDMSNYRNVWLKRRKE